MWMRKIAKVNPTLKFGACMGTVNRFRLVAADVSRLKFPPIKSERTHVRCYEVHGERGSATSGKAEVYQSASIEE